MSNDVPSLGKLLTATATAFVVAAIILVAFVLPAEYGIDPLHTGRALGLTSLANATAEPSPRPANPVEPPRTAPNPAEPRTTSINPVLVPSPSGGAPTVRDVFIPQPDRFQFDSREITLDAGEGMEIKYDMKQGAGMLYSWTASAPLAYEFHGEPDVKPAGKAGTDYFESYDLHDKAGRASSHGTFLAPSTGIHGWFWENTTGKPVSLKLVTAGYYDWITQNRKNKHTAFMPMDPYLLPGHPKVADEVVR